MLEYENVERNELYRLFKANLPQFYQTLLQTKAKAAAKAKGQAKHSSKVSPSSLHAPLTPQVQPSSPCSPSKLARSFSRSPSRRFAKFSGALLCVPQALSLRHKQEKHDVLRHLLYSIDEDAGRFANLGGNMVVVEGAFVRIISSFDSRRSKRVRLMFTEEIDLSDEHPNVGIVRIMHIDRPLVGGPKVECTVQDMGSEQINAYLTLLLCMPELGTTFAQMQGFLARVKRLKPADDDLPEILRNVQLHFRNWVLLASQVLSSSPAFHRLFTDSDLTTQYKRHKVQMQHVFEGFAALQCGHSILSIVSRLYASQDRQINRVLSGLCRNRFSQADLGMRAEFRGLQEDAAEELACLALKQTPLEKLRCLDRTVHKINEGVQANLKRLNIPIGSHPLTTDDLLDQLIFVMIQAFKKGLRNIVTQLQFIRAFHLQDVNTSSLGYVLASFEVAMSWLRKRDEERDYLAALSSVGVSF